MSDLSNFEKKSIYMVKNIQNNNILNGIMMIFRFIPLFLTIHD